MQLKPSKHVAKLLIGSFIFLIHFPLFFYPKFESKSFSSYKKAISVHTYMQPKQKMGFQIKSSFPSSHKKRKKIYAKKTQKREKNQSNRTAIFKKILGELDKLSFSPIEKSPLTLPKKITSLSIDENPSITPNYQELLTTFLKQNLELPEEGMTKIKMTILQNGSVEKVRILYTQSILNGSYLEKNLFKISCPPFPKELSGKEKQTFILFFYHEN